MAFEFCYDVRSITEADISDVYSLCRSNRKYYEAIGGVPTVESLTEVISRAPENDGDTQKYLVGFYDQEKLIALMDLITGYPEGDDAFIGWFMVDGHLQRQGIGSQIFADVRCAMKGQGFDHLTLRCEKENREAIAFWKAQGFREDGSDEKGIHFSRAI